MLGPMTGRTFFRTALIALALIIVAALIFVWPKANDLARTGAGYKAKVACSEIFVAQRDPDRVMAIEFEGIDPLLRHVKTKTDLDGQSVTAAAPLGIGKSKAVFRDGYGCSLIPGGKPPAALPALAPMAQSERANAASVDRVDAAALAEALDKAIANTSAGHRAFVVIVDGALVGEAYADGFNADTRLLSWSMAKSITAMLIGAAAQQGYLDINDPAPVPEWADDPSRANITWNDLLRMQSGLLFEEEYGVPTSDVNRMLFQSASAAGVAALSPAGAAPGEVFYYSSGTSNLLARALNDVLKSNGTTLHQFAQSAVLEKIGAGSFVLEPDAGGDFVGSSFAYATARDWARAGELLLAKGVWDGEHILAPGWSDYVQSVASASDNQYGAHFWLNLQGENGRERFFKGLPDSAYSMSGHEGQYVFILPEDNAVIVRLGMTRGSNPVHAVDPVLAEIMDTIGADD